VTGLTAFGWDKEESVEGLDVLHCVSFATTTYFRVGVYHCRIGADAALRLRVFLLDDGPMLCIKDTILLRKNAHGPE